MTENQLEKQEQKLAKAGYRKYNNTSSSNDYSWFKTIRNPQDHEDWFYIIEWRVWDWTKYIDRDPSIAKRPYSMELCIIVRLPDEGISRMLYPDGLTVEQGEELALKFYEMVKEAKKQIKKRK